MSYVADRHHLIVPRDTFAGMRSARHASGALTTPFKDTLKLTKPRLYSWAECEKCGQLVEVAKNGKLDKDKPIVLDEHYAKRGDTEPCEASGTLYEGSIVVS